MSTVGELHVPPMLLFDIAGSAGTVAAAHITNDVPKSNVGVILGVTVTLNEVAVAHCPIVGVNV